jgi:hypothetical protein
MDASVARRRGHINNNHGKTGQGKAVRWEIREFLTRILAAVLIGSTSSTASASPSSAL